MTEQYTVTIEQKGTERVVRREGHLSQICEDNAARIAHRMLSELGTRFVKVTATVWNSTNYQIQY